MKELIIKNNSIRERFEFLLDLYYKNISDEHVKFIKTVIYNFKINSNNENYLIVILLYGLIFFKKIDINNPYILKSEKEQLLKLLEIYKYELLGEKNKFLDSMYKLDNELRKLKVILKYSVILFENKSTNIIISNRDNYYKSLGYSIPFLTLKGTRLLGFFQDAYFKELYPDTYIKTKMVYLEKMKKTGTTGEYIINIVNNLNETLDDIGVSAIMKMRKKSYFSIYNKIKRKQHADFLDSIGVRIIFNNLEELRKYENIFEEKFIYLKKKDYILNPKDNGYQSLHYNFMIPYGNNEVYVELQLRTLDIDRNIYQAKEISHYSYTIKKDKWNSLFKEVDFGYNHLLNYIESENDKKKTKK